MSGTINFDSDGALTRVASALRALADAAGAELAQTLDIAAPVLVAGARARASQWSTQIPPTIHALPAADGGTAVTMVIEAGRGVPIARLMQKGAPSKPGKPWKHPVYGNPNAWGGQGDGPQPMHPYLDPDEAEVLALSKVVLDSLSQTTAEALDGASV